MTDNSSQQARTNQPEAPKTTGGARMIMTMGALGLVCGALIVGTFQATLPAITRNKAILLEQSILTVIPNATRMRPFVESNGTLSPADDNNVPGTRYYAGYDDQGVLEGVAVETAGQGFQDMVHVIYGYSPKKQAVVGLKVLESHETPGLGTKTESDPRFCANFDSLQVVVGPDNTVENPISLAKYGEKEHPWQVEAITGATISSRAIAAMLKASTESTVPVIMNNLNVLEGGAP